MKKHVHEGREHFPRYHPCCPLPVVEGSAYGALSGATSAQSTEENPVRWAAQGRVRVFKAAGLSLVPGSLRLEWPLLLPILALL